MSLRVVFMGTPDFSVPTLMEIVGQGHDVIACYSQPPRPAGRGHGSEEVTGPRGRRVLCDPGFYAQKPEGRRRAGKVSPRWTQMLRSSSLMVSCCRKPFSMRRNSAASICTLRCCRAGAAQPRSTGPLWPATRKPPFRSCGWKKASIPAGLHVRNRCHRPQHDRRGIA